MPVPRLGQVHRDGPVVWYDRDALSLRDEWELNLLPLVVDRDGAV